MQKSEKGFSLVELMTVAAIIAMLTVIAMPAYQNHAARAKATAAFAEIAIHIKRRYAVALGDGAQLSLVAVGFQSESTGNCTAITATKNGITCIVHHLGRLSTSATIALIYIGYNKQQAA